ncbi:MAG TPA: UDP-N-acetylmuramoyl-tripeptide--D-alanyl-D-alanine ligase [Candidatus Dormibacteraeota bacterium]|nr:UDP-N-acetylmuramoyl-tripeptide--D-alanyl-D-alanine ligase [Candidatus Dormibacteraeota bacterium]
MRLSLAEVLEATGGRLVGGPGDRVFGDYHVDSRAVVPGGLFFALRGAVRDGHEFCADAVGRGAGGLVVERPTPPEGVGGVAVVRVEDTWRALYALAAHVLRRVSPLVVGVTGSNGKTSTREMTAAVLGVRHRVLRSEGNLNTETGVPLTLLRLRPEHTAAVVEMGMQRAGEIARLAELARPRVGVVTMIGSVHMEFFADRDDLARAKGELVQALPADGLAVLNADDPYFDLLRGLSPAPVVGFGLEAGDLRGSGYRPLPEGGAALTVEGVPVRLALNGRHQARNALAALAVGRYAGVPLAEAAAALAGVGVEHRLQEYRLPGGYTLVDDAYNASPESMLAAFEAVAERPRCGRLLALLGPMAELGRLSPAAHVEVGRRAGELFDRVAVLDSGDGRLLAEAAGGELLAGRTEAVRWVRETARSGDLVLVKGSHGVALHEVVNDLLDDLKSKPQMSGGATCCSI